MNDLVSYKRRPEDVSEQIAPTFGAIIEINAEDKGSASTAAEQEKGSDEPNAAEKAANKEKRPVSLVQAVQERPENETQDKTRNQPRSNVNSTHVSTTDPDASIVRQGGKPHLSYKTHRAVDPLHEVITAVEVTPGAVNEAHKMADLIENHEKNTDKKVTTVVADEVGHFMGLIDRTRGDFNSSNYLMEGVNGPVRFIIEMRFSSLPYD